MGQGERAHQPTKGLSGPSTPSHITRRCGGATPRAAAPPGLGGKFPRGWGRPNPSRVSPVAAAHPLWKPRAPPPPPFPLYIVREREGSRTSSLAQPSLLLHLLLLHSAWRSPAGEPQTPPPPPRRAVGLLPQLILSPCWIKKEDTSPGCTCVEHGGAVRLALDRIFRDLNCRKYDSIIRVLETLSLSDLQGYEDAHPLPLLLLESP